MAIIYSYPTAFPSVSDLILGTHISETVDGDIHNTTVNFTVQSLLGLIANTTGAQTLQQVTNLGSVTTNAITINNALTVGTNLSVTGAFVDSTSSPGTLNQVLSSTVTGTKWVADNAGLNYFVTGAGFNTGTGVLSITGNNAAVGATVDLDGRYITGNETITLSGDITGSGATAITTTLASVNSNTGNFTNANISVNAKGLVTAASSGTAGGVTKIVAGSRITITPASGLGDVTINSAAEVDTLQTVTSRGSTTNQSITMNGSGTNGYLYVSGNAGNPVTNPVHTQGFAFAYNNSGGSRECEIFWNTGTTTAATNNVAYLGFYNEFLNSAAGNARVTDLQMKLYGTGQLELTGNTPTISNPYWRMPTTAAPNTGYVLAKSSGSINLEWVVNGNSNSGIVEEVVVNAGVALLSKTVTVPSTATSIAANGFEGEAITSLILNSNLITIGAFAFNDNRLPTISLPNTLQTISSNAFNKNLLVGTLVIPASVTSIGEKAFFADTDKLLNKITGLTLSSTNLTTIGVDAFTNNPIATNITFPTSVTSIGNNSFVNTLLSGVTIPNNCTVGNSAFNQVALPSGNGFASSFTLTIGTGVTLGENCFSNLKHVSSLTVPSDVTLAASGFQFASFESSTSTITAITYAGTTYSAGMFSGQSIASLTINNNSVVNTSAFNGNPLSSLTIGTGVTIKDFCFGSMPTGTSLAVTIPTGTIFISSSQFSSSKNITSVVMGAIVIIPQNMFGNCNNIASLTLNNATTTYSSSCFNNALASSITQITFGGSAKTFGNNAFTNNSLTAVTVPIGSTNTSSAFDSGVTITFA